MEKNALYNLVVYQMMEEAFQKEEEEIQEIFGELSEEQTLYLSDLRRRYFGLGLNIHASIHHFSARQMAGDLQ